MAKSQSSNLKTIQSINEPASPPKRTRGRPREFDRDVALERAMQTFWRQGYEATSMADLRSSLGLTQASLYAAFGDKATLFREAVDLYRRSVGITTQRALTDKPTARASIHAMLQSAAESFTALGTPPGCLVVLGTMNCSQESKPVQDHLLALRHKTPDSIVNRLERGQNEGDVPRDAPVRALAAYYTTVLHGLSIQARDGADRETLTHVVQCAMATWDSVVISPRQEGR